ncbi:MAG: hypothetical protein AAFP70_02015, partial [Calditrichota bacterium]
VLIGRLFTTGMVLVGIVWIPLTKFINSNMYVHLQTMQAYISPPIAAVFITGLIWRRANGRSAFGALISGGVIGMLRLLYDMDMLGNSLLADIIQPFASLNFLHFAAALFLTTIAIMTALSYLLERSGRRASGNLVLSKESLRFLSSDNPNVNAFGVLIRSHHQILSIVLMLVIAVLAVMFI